ncbi:hypothetical protein MGN70_005534 [Eutypa lata]|nr:hypothetical protein MGN70_005534 [Eutypa lata]
MTAADEVEVSLVSDQEIPTCFQVVSESFGHDAPFVDIYFPGHDTPLGRADGSRRLTTWKQTDKNSAFLKATTRVGQRAQERIIGIAVWTYMKEAPPSELAKVEDVENVWPVADDREFMTRLWKEYVIPRSEAIEGSSGKGVYVLEMLAVHPHFQRLGAGTALVKWGTNAADEQGLKAVVEGTPVGRRLYESCGFHAEIEEMRFEVGQEFAGRNKPKLIFLTREPKS